MHGGILAGDMTGVVFCACPKGGLSAGDMTGIVFHTLIAKDDMAGVVFHIFDLLVDTMGGFCAADMTGVVFGTYSKGGLSAAHMTRIVFHAVKPALDVTIIVFYISPSTILRAASLIIKKISKRASRRFWAIASRSRP